MTYKLGVAAGLVMLGITTLAYAGVADQTPAQELVNYIQNARHRGMKDASIKSNAVAIGWPAAIVEQAIAYVKTEKKDTVTPAAETVTVQNTAATEPSLPPAGNLPLQATPPAGPADANAHGHGVVADDYIIGAGDVLSINVWGEISASVPSEVVRPDGKITLPLLKEIEVVGQTPAQLEKAITERLAKMINNPDVTVMVTQINSKKVYIVGAVKKEGPLSYTYRMSIMQALSEAGGLTDYAKRKKIYVLRTEKGKDFRFQFNYEEVIKGEKMEQNIQMLPGDTLVIPH